MFERLFLSSSSVEHWMSYLSGITGFDGTLSDGTSMTGYQQFDSRLVARDSLDNIIVLISYDSSGYDRSLLLKFNASGALQWSKRLNYWFNTLAVDRFNNIIIARKKNNARIARLTPDGTLSWVKRITQISSFESMATGYDTIYLVGKYGSYPQYALLTKLDSSGNVVFQRAITEPGFSYITGTMVVTNDTSVWMISQDPSGFVINEAAASDGAVFASKRIGSYVRIMDMALAGDASFNGVIVIGTDDNNQKPVLMGLNTTGIAFQRNIDIANGHGVSCKYDNSSGVLLITYTNLQNVYISRVEFSNSLPSIVWTRTLSGSAYNATNSRTAVVGMKHVLSSSNTTYNVLFMAATITNDDKNEVYYSPTVLQLPLDGTKTGTVSTTSQTLTYSSVSNPSLINSAFSSTDPSITNNTGAATFEVNTVSISNITTTNAQYTAI